MKTTHAFTFRGGLVATLAAVVFAAVPPAGATETTIGDLIWTHTSGTVKGVKSASGASITSLTIPGTLGESTVESIASSAFRSMSYLESVSFPASVRTIGSSAFYNCERLRTVSFGSNLETIQSEAFRYCERLTSVSFPASLRSIGTYAFCNCPALKTATFNEGLETIGERAFASATSLGNFVLPSTLQTIYSCAFSGCTALTSVSIPDSVTAIGHDAFNGCTGLQTATIGNGLQKLPSSSFYGCSRLRTVSFGSKLETIQSEAFRYCERLTSVSFPASLRSIETYAFCNCPALRTVTFNEGLETIGERAFASATSLGNFVLPSTLQTIYSCAFSGCTALTSVSIPDSVTAIGHDAFNGCTGLKTATIGNGLYEIPRSCFYNCSALETVGIGESVDTIHSEAFRYCGKLMTFVAAGDAIDEESYVGSYAFSGVPSTMIVYVDADARGWGTTWKGFTVFVGSPSKHTVTLDRQNGTGGTASVMATCGAAMPAITVPTRTGYRFGGYYTAKNGGGTQYYTAAGASARAWNKAASATLYASWSEITYKIRFHANGGKGTMADQIFRYDQWQNLRKNQFVRTDYAFAGWSQSSSATSPQFSNGHNVHVNTSYTGTVLDLYAVWNPTTYTVKFAANGGKGSMAVQKMTAGKAAKLRKNAFTRTGWLFLGWSKTKNGAVAFKNAAAVKNVVAAGQSVTLYAQWAKKSYKVAFYANGGTGKMSAQKMTYGKAKKLTANKFKKKGYVFKGWAKSKALAKKGTVAYKNKKSVKNLVKNGKTVKLYAVWKKK